MRGAVPPPAQYASTAWCSVKKKSQAQLYLTKSVTFYIKTEIELNRVSKRMTQCIKLFDDIKYIQLKICNFYSKYF
jgi:hypothetical protein